MRFSLIHISSYLVVCESVFTLFGVMGMLYVIDRSPFFAIPLLIWLSMAIINFYTLRISRNFTFFFYHSGHWKKMMRDYLQPRDQENDPPPDFKKLKIFLWLSMILSGIITLVMAGAVASVFSHGAGKAIGPAIGLLALRGGQAFYIYWTWRGINFVSKYADVDPGIVL